MKRAWEAIQHGYLRVIEPVADLMVRRRVSPNAITTFGTLCTIVAGVIYATGHISIAGWVFGLTALFDVLDGTVARRTGRTTTFGAFYDSTLDRVADGAILGGLAIFFGRNNVLHGVPSWAGTPMLGVTILAIIATFLTSYTRARAEALGIGMKGIGIMERPERVVLLSAPQAFFGLALDGYVLMFIVTLLGVTAWITAVQRIAHVYRVTTAADAALAAGAASAAPTSGAASTPGARLSGEGAPPVRRTTVSRAALKGD